MKIMGLDLSVTQTGVSLYCGITRAYRPRTLGDWRLEEITNWVTACANDSGTQLVVMEDVPSTMQGAAGKVIPMLHGAVRLDLMREGVKYAVLSPSTLKKFATGSGNADKTQMAIAALKRLGREYRTDDECDADWLRIAGGFAYGEPEQLDGGSVLTMPQVQVQALRTNAKGKPVDWPILGMLHAWA